MISPAPPPKGAAPAAARSLDAVLADLKRLAKKDWVLSMQRVGITGAQMWGVPVPDIRQLAKRLGADHGLARQLWETGIHEARILATLLGDPAAMPGRELDGWLRDLDSWDITDAYTGNLVVRSGHAWGKAVEWAGRKKLFEKRAAFALMAALAVHDKASDDEAFKRLLPVIWEHAVDSRPYVAKAVSWALRQIGKRNRTLNRAALACSQEIQALNNQAARWVASDVQRELLSPAVLMKLTK
jgi:3-methyladenine DNA glycosylase AlkD